MEIVRHFIYRHVLSFIFTSSITLVYYYIKPFFCVSCQFLALFAGFSPRLGVLGRQFVWVHNNIYQLKWRCTKPSCQSKPKQDYWFVGHLSLNNRQTCRSTSIWKTSERLDMFETNKFSWNVLKRGKKLPENRASESGHLRSMVSEYNVISWSTSYISCIWLKYLLCTRQRRQKAEPNVPSLCLIV